MNDRTREFGDGEFAESGDAQTSIDGDHLSRHSFGSWIGERHNPPSHVIWMAAPLQRYPLALPLLDGLSLLWRAPSFRSTRPIRSAPLRSR